MLWKSAFHSMLLVSVLSLAVGCTNSNEGSIKQSLLEVVPGDASIVAIFDLGKIAADTQALTPFAGFDERWQAMGDDFNEVVKSELGIELFEAERGVAWQGGDGWCVVFWGDFEGELTGEGVTERDGVSIREVQSDQFLAAEDGRVFVGNENGVFATLDVLSGETESLEDADGEEAELLIDLLDEVGSAGTVAVAALGDALPTQELEGMVPPVVGAVLLSQSAAYTVRLRLESDEDAERLLSQANMMLMGVRQEIRSRRDDASEENIDEAFEAIAAHHGLSLVLDELLELRTDGEDFVVDLALGGQLGSSTAFIGVAAAVAIPAFLKYINRSKAAEAQMNLRRLYDSAINYYDTDHVSPTGQLLPPQFPASIPLTPEFVPCGDKEFPVASEWEQPTWQALNFAMVDPHYYSYQFDSSGIGPGATFTASAFGDLDCDGIYSTFIRTGEVSSGGEVRGGRGLIQNNEME